MGSSTILGSLQLTPEQYDLISNNMEEFKSIFHQILKEQSKTNDLLAMLIDAMSNEEEDQDAQPLTYMDGSYVR